MYERDAQAFIELVKQAGVRASGQTFPDSQLGKQQEMVEQVQLGSLEMVVSSSEFVSAVPEFGVFDLPFAFGDRAEVKRAVESRFGEELTAAANKRNLIVLGFWENGFRHLTNNLRPIRTPEDLAGLRIRTPPNPDRITMFHTWGAQPAPLDWDKLFASLESGVFDGQENPVAQITAGQLYRVQKYLSFTGHVYTPSYLVASKRWWDTVPPSTQQALREAARAIGDVSRARGMEADRQGVEVVKQAGMQINDDVDKDAFRRASVSMYGDYEKRFGSRLVELMQEAKDH